MVKDVWRMGGGTKTKKTLLGDSMLLQSLAALLPLLLVSKLPDISAINTTSLQDCYRTKEKPCFAEKPQLK